MGSLVVYYRRQAGRGREDIEHIYITPSFMQRWHGLGSVLTGLFRTVRPILWSKETLKALGREALRTEGKILTEIAKNHQSGTRDMISNHETDSSQNIIRKLRGGGGSRKRKTASSTL